MKYMIKIEEVNLHILKNAVKNQTANECTGHDWLHICRVLNLADKIVEEENIEVDMNLIEILSLLHDIEDRKFRKKDDTSSVVCEFIMSSGGSRATAIAIKSLIDQISYSCECNNVNNSEVLIIQDADKLDALGAIGIARVFAYGGFKMRPIYDPEILPITNMSKEEYKKHTGTSLNHFFEKLLDLPKYLNTKTARNIAHERVAVMRCYLDNLMYECDIHHFSDYY